MKKTLAFGLFTNWIDVDFRLAIILQLSLSLKKLLDYHHYIKSTATMISWSTTYQSSYQERTQDEENSRIWAIHELD
jgi:hypothetical protein